MKKSIRFVLLTASLAMLCFVTLISTYAADETASSTQTVSDGQSSSVLMDEKYGTKLTLSKGTTVTVTAPDTIYGLYLIWDKPVGTYTVTTGSGSIKCGENGFIHEYIRIAAGTKKAVINVPADGSVLCDVCVLSKGELPSFVQTWIPPYKKADMLVLPTHADDEYLFFGGTLPYYAGQKGLKVQVAYLTNHWGESYRTHELLNGLWICGVKAYPVIGPFNDAQCKTLEIAEQRYGYDNVLKYQVELIRRFKPEVIIGHDLNGEYGHGMHQLNARTLAAALDITGDKTQYTDSAEKYGTWVVPKTYLHLYPENTVDMEWDTPLSAFGGKTAFDVALEAFAVHYSQNWDYTLTRTGGTECVSFGLYRSTVGADTPGTNDFMENIDLKKDDETTTASSKKAAVTTTKAAAKETKAERSSEKYIEILIAIFIVIGTAYVIFLAVKAGKKRFR
jgi:LmbE family N-acetylglucosaminyl deacetylase